MRMIQRHFQKNIEVVNILIRSGRKNIYVLSLLITESYFRNSIQRYIELCYWKLAYYVYPSRVGLISVGVAQVQIRHWVKFGYIDSERPSIRNIRTVLDIYKNYDLCFDYIIEKDAIKNNSLTEIALCYRGILGLYYSNLLNDSCKLVSGYIESLRKRHFG